jgi:hypothetical protein
LSAAKLGSAWPDTLSRRRAGAADQTVQPRAGRAATNVLDRHSARVLRAL